MKLVWEERRVWINYFKYWLSACSPSVRAKYSSPKGVPQPAYVILVIHRHDSLFSDALIKWENKTQNEHWPSWIRGQGLRIWPWGPDSDLSSTSDKQKPSSSSHFGGTLALLLALGELQLQSLGKAEGQAALNCAQTPGWERKSAEPGGSTASKIPSNTYFSMHSMFYLITRPKVVNRLVTGG